MWVIFRMLQVWSIMVLQDEEAQDRAMKRMQSIARGYLIVWSILWGAQRYIEYRIIHEE